MSILSHGSNNALTLCHLDVSWARPATDFDTRIFKEDAWPFDEWQERLSSPIQRFYAYVIPAEGMQTRGDIAALGGISFEGDVEIVTLGVSPTWRGQGLGGNLFDILIGEAEKTDGATDIFLDVRADNDVALHLYESRGFEVCGRRQNYYGQCDALVFHRSLAKRL